MQISRRIFEFLNAVPTDQQNACVRNIGNKRSGLDADGIYLQISQQKEQCGENAGGKYGLCDLPTDDICKEKGVAALQLNRNL